MIIFLFIASAVCLVIAGLSKEEDRSASDFAMGACACSFFFALMMIIYPCTDCEIDQAAAVEVGHAEYYLDPETHERQWRWLPACDEKP